MDKELVRAGSIGSAGHPARPGGDTLYYRQAGNGNHVILLHGFAEDGRIWDRQINRLATDYRLLIPDLPGSGLSSPIPPDAETSMDTLADAVKAVLDREGIDRCTLIGHSLGGYIALAFAEKYPERLGALGLFHSTAYADSEEKKENRRKGVGFIQKNGALPFIRQSTPNLFAEGSRIRHPEWVEDFIERYGGIDPDTLIKYQEAMIGRPDRTAVLEDFAGPVLFVIGGQDQLVPLEHSLRQSHLPRLSHIRILPDAGHMGMQEDSDRSYQILSKFLNFVYRL